MLQQTAQQWASNQQLQQPSGPSHTNLIGNPQGNVYLGGNYAGRHGYNSTENIVKRSDDATAANLTMGGLVQPGTQEKRNSSLNKPQYQNLVNDS